MIYKFLWISQGFRKIKSTTESVLDMVGYITPTRDKQVLLGKIILPYQHHLPGLDTVTNSTWLTELGIWICRFHKQKQLLKLN